MTRIILLSAVLALLLLAVAGWTVRGVRWAIVAPSRRPRAGSRDRLATA